MSHRSHVLMDLKAEVCCSYAEIQREMAAAFDYMAAGMVRARITGAVKGDTAEFIAIASALLRILERQGSEA